MTQAQQNSIVRAIREAEAGTAVVSPCASIPDHSVDAFERAERSSQQHRAAPARGGNAALILVAPKARQFAVLGDRALHDRVGDDLLERRRRAKSAVLCARRNDRRHSLRRRADRRGAAGALCRPADGGSA